jgi:2-octaprenyl-6-methoxyphenol hydroxylase
LVVGADGSNSQIRSQAGIQTRGWHYSQACLVATVLPEFSHQNIAYERFWPSGPFAILPSTPKECRIVWTVSEQDATALLNLDINTFTQELQKRYGNQMGQIQVVSERYAFPAKIQQARDYVRSRIALVGNAAHTCHPVGGQGLNLGIRDADALATVILRTYHRGQDIGTLQALKPYQRRRKRQNFASLGFTDILNRVFSNEYPVIQPARRLGLRIMQRVPFIRVNALKFMAGLLAF